ncbi:phytase [Olivibacter ginsenosidimutans]|uniref:Phytase n=2 Tax=Olivibacter ginsenosidimutans TaxID=1176537 RepID=A0ABP9B9T3_9SPHI
MGACVGRDKTPKEVLQEKVDTLQADVITESVKHDADDPAIWINPQDASKSLIIGTDKDEDGGLYMFDLNGKIVGSFTGISRPNNVDVAYGLKLKGRPTDIAVTTERLTNRLRIFSLPDLKPVDQGGFEVFTGEAERAPMGIAIYTRPADHAIFAIVSRKSGPNEGYLWQYRLRDNGNGEVGGELVRKFGKYSGKKEIESIAVDNEWGFVYYSDEQTGVRKYLADPDVHNDKELALFGDKGFSEDNEGIAIYKTGEKSGYILVSNQGSHTLMVYPRKGGVGDGHEHPLLAEIPVSAQETDGIDATAVRLGSKFPEGMVVSMSTDKTFHLFDWRKIKERIRK